MKKGVKREISRRDFLDGVALVAGGMALSPLISSANSGQAFSHVVYPPSLTGMRGNHPGSYEVAHALARYGLLALIFIQLVTNVALIATLWYKLG